jgi:hypothetical protein
VTSVQKSGPMDTSVLILFSYTPYRSCGNYFQVMMSLRPIIRLLMIYLPSCVLFCLQQLNLGLNNLGPRGCGVRFKDKVC